MAEDEAEAKAREIELAKEVAENKK